MMYDTDYAIYQYINAQVEQYVEFDDLLKQNHCTMEEAQQEIKAFREKYHSLLCRGMRSVTVTLLPLVKN